MQRSAPIILGAAAAVAVAVVAFLSLTAGDAAPPDGSPSIAPSAAASAVASRSAASDIDETLLDRRWTVLFVGTDLDARREADASFVPSADALLVVTISADASELALVSVPRDTVDAPLADGSTYPGKVNALYADRGIDALVDAIAGLTGLPIDGHVVMDMDDFTGLVDAVGTVEVDPEAPLTDPIVDLDLDAGPQEIDAPTANGYVRTRVDQDYGRMGRQQEVILSLVDRLTDPDRELDLRALLDGLESLETDLPLDELPTLLELARRATAAEVERLVIRPPLITFEGDRGDGRGYVLEPDVEAIRMEVDRLVGG